MVLHLKNKNVNRIGNTRCKINIQRSDLEKTNVEWDFTTELVEGQISDHNRKTQEKGFIR